jgi:ferredoxin
LKEWGAEPQRIHSEAFGPAASFAPNVVSQSHNRSALSRPAQDSGPQIAFVRSGVTVSWDQQFSSLLDLAEAFDIPVRWSCRTGVCHTCECSLIGGDVDYSPAPVESPAAGNVLICCAQPKSDLQLDL